MSSTLGRDPVEDPQDGLAGPPRCSAKGCRAEATVDLRWRNPTLHELTRVKHWLACPEHAGQLAAFLSTRGFLLDQGSISA